MKEVGSPYCKCLYYSSNALARVMTKMAEACFESCGLSPSYAFVVMTVNKNPGLHTGELAEMMMLTPSTITRLLEKLEARELVKRVKEGRNTLVFPTRSSVELNERILLGWQELYKRIAASTLSEEAERLTAGIYQAAVSLSGK